MDFLSNSRWQNSKERPKRFANNGCMSEKAKHDVVNEWHLSNYRESELLKRKEERYRNDEKGKKEKELNWMELRGSKD